MRIADSVIIVKKGGSAVLETHVGESPLETAMFTPLIDAVSSATEELLDEQVRHISLQGKFITLYRLPAAGGASFLTISDREHLRDPEIAQKIFQYVLEPFQGNINDIFQLNPLIFRPIIQRIRQLLLGERSFPETAKANGLIITVGITWGPILSAITAHDPRYTVFIISRNTREIAQRVTDTLGLLHGEEFEYSFEVDPDDAASVVDAAKKAYDHLTDRLETTEGILVNATGGRKPMTTGASLFSFFKTLPVWYVRSRSFDRTRKDMFYEDTEIVLLTNPIETVGILLEEQAIEAFNRQDFEEAKRQFTNLMQNVSDYNQSVRYSSFAYLSKAYFLQDALNWQEAQKAYAEGLGILEDVRRRQPMINRCLNLDHLKKQQEIIARLAKYTAADGSVDISNELWLIAELINSAKRRLRTQRIEGAIARTVIALLRFARLKLGSLLPEESSLLRVRSLNEALESSRFDLETIRELKHEKQDNQAFIETCDQILKKMESLDGLVCNKWTTAREEIVYVAVDYLEEELSLLSRLHMNISHPCQTLTFCCISSPGDILGED